MITIERLTPDDWRTWRELRVAALGEAPDAFSSTLADWQGQGDAEDRWRRRLTSVPFNVVAYLDRTPAGMVGGTQPKAAKSDAEKLEGQKTQEQAKVLSGIHG